MRSKSDNFAFLSYKSTNILRKIYYNNFNQCRSLLVTQNKQYKTKLIRIASSHLAQPKCSLWGDVKYEKEKCINPYTATQKFGLENT